VTFVLPKLPTSDLVAAAWIGSIPGLDPGMVATVLPSDDGKWAKTGFIRIATVGGSPNIYLPVKEPVVQVDCFATIPGSNQPPWAHANGLAEIIRQASLQRVLMRRPLTLSVRGHPFGQAVVQSAYLLTEPQRRYSDAANYAIYSFDMQFSWVTVADVSTD
jgi:hypothetical protein